MDMTAMFKLSYGLYVVSSSYEGKDAACVVNTLSQITASPIQVSVAVNKDNFTCQQIQKSGRFEGVVLSEDIDMGVIGTFGFQSSKDVDKFEGLAHERDTYGIPYLSEHVSARVSCKVVQSVDVGTHILFIAEVEDAQHMVNEPVMTYSYYHQVKNGTTPKNASSYQPVEEKKSGWKCSVCGYIYEGDLLPEDFICPICHQDASVFEKL